MPGIDKAPAARRRRDRALDRGRRRAARISARRGDPAARPADQRPRQPVRGRRDAGGVDGDHRDRDHHAVAQPPVSHGAGRTPARDGRRATAADVAHGPDRGGRGDRVAAAGRAAVADELRSWVSSSHRPMRAPRRPARPACAAGAAGGTGAVVQRLLASRRVDDVAHDGGVRRRGDRGPQAAARAPQRRCRPATNTGLDATASEPDPLARAAELGLAEIGRPEPRTAGSDHRVLRGDGTRTRELSGSRSAGIGYAVGGVGPSRRTPRAACRQRDRTGRVCSRRRGSAHT